jgi:hypothetical protein
MGACSMPDEILWEPKVRALEHSGRQAERESFLELYDRVGLRRECNTMTRSSDGRGEAIVLASLSSPTRNFK